MMDNYFHQIQPGGDLAVEEYADGVYLYRMPTASRFHIKAEELAALAGRLAHIVAEREIKASEEGEE